MSAKLPRDKAIAEAVRLVGLYRRRPQKSPLGEAAMLARLMADLRHLLRMPDVPLLLEALGFKAQRIEYTAATWGALEWQLDRRPRRRQTPWGKV